MKKQNKKYQWVSSLFQIWPGTPKEFLKDLQYSGRPDADLAWHSKGVPEGFTVSRPPRPQAAVSRPDQPTVLRLVPTGLKSLRPRTNIFHVVIVDQHEKRT